MKKWLPLASAIGGVACMIVASLVGRSRSRSLPSSW
jgi:hypothetical protein